MYKHHSYPHLLELRAGGYNFPVWFENLVGVGKEVFFLFFKGDYKAESNISLKMWNHLEL